jgi:hypothetical protein
LVNRVLRAFTEAIHSIKTNKEDTTWVRHLRIGGVIGSIGAFQIFRVLGFNVLGDKRVAEGVKTLLDDIAPRTPKAATADPKSFVDMKVSSKNWRRQDLSSRCIKDEGTAIQNVPFSLLVKGLQAGVVTARRADRFNL